MTTFSSVIQVLSIENEERVSKSKGTKYQHFAARCILLSDEGEVITVGSLTGRRVPPELRDSLKVGTHRAHFALKVPDYGDDKGEIVSVLTGLTAVVKQAPTVASKAAL